MKMLLCCTDGNLEMARDTKMSRRCKTAPNSADKVAFNPTFNKCCGCNQRNCNQQIPVIIELIIRHLLSSCQLEKQIFIKYAKMKEIAELKERLQAGISKFNPQAYDPYLLASILMEYVVSIDGGIFSALGEECLLSMAEVPSKSYQAEIFHRLIESIHPLLARLTIRLFHLFFAITNNYFINQVNVPDLAQSIAPFFFKSTFHSFFVKYLRLPGRAALGNFEKKKAAACHVMELIFNNSRLARQLTYEQYSCWLDSSAQHVSYNRATTFPSDYQLYNERLDNDQSGQTMHPSATDSGKGRGLIRSSQLLSYAALVEMRKRQILRNSLLMSSRHSMRPSFAIEYNNMSSGSLHEDFVHSLRSTANNNATSITNDSKGSRTSLLDNEISQMDHRKELGSGGDSDLEFEKSVSTVEGYLKFARISVQDESLPCYYDEIIIEENS